MKQKKQLNMVGGEADKYSIRDALRYLVDESMRMDNVQQAIILEEALINLELIDNCDFDKNDLDENSWLKILEFFRGVFKLDRNEIRELVDVIEFFEAVNNERSDTIKIH